MPSFCSVAMATVRWVSTARLTILRQAALARTAAAAAAAAAAATATARPFASQAPPPSPPAKDLDYRSDTRLKVTGMPVVYHPLYSAPRLSPGHRFPMVRTGCGQCAAAAAFCSQRARTDTSTTSAALQQVFGRIYDRLLAEGTVVPRQVHVPPSLPSRDLLCLAHGPEYVNAFCSGSLGEP